MHDEKSQLHLEKRGQIQVWLNVGKKITEMAQFVEKDKLGISREIKCNRGHNERYVAPTAQQLKNDYEGRA